MIARRDRSNTTYAQKRNRSVSLGRRSIAKLAISVPTPRHDGSIAFGCRGMILPGCNSRYIRHPSGLHGRQPLSRRSIAELAVGVVAPVPNCPVSL